METEKSEDKIVTLGLDDGSQFLFPVSLLHYMKSLHAMMEDIGTENAEVTIPVANITKNGLTFFVGLLTEIDSSTSEEWHNSNIARLIHSFSEEQDISVRQMMELYIFLDFVDCPAALPAVEAILINKMMDRRFGLQFQRRIEIDDVHAWRGPQLRPVVDYILEAMPYARRYREILSYLREHAPNVASMLIEKIPRPTLQPVVCGYSFALVLTPAGLFYAGNEENKKKPIKEQLQAPGFNPVAITGDVITFTMTQTGFMVMTTSGLYTGIERFYNPIKKISKVDVENIGVTTRILDFAANTNERFFLTQESVLVDELLYDNKTQNFYHTGNALELQGRPLSLFGTPLSVYVRTTTGITRIASDEKMQVADGTVRLHRVRTMEPYNLLDNDELLAVAERGKQKWFLTRLGGLMSDLNARGLFLNEVVIGVACTENGVVALTPNSVMTKGANTHGELGKFYGDEKKEGRFRKSILPGQSGPTPPNNIAVACGHSFTVILTDQGVFTSGINSALQLGYVTEGTKNTKTVGFQLARVPGLPLVAQLSQIADRRMVFVRREVQAGTNPFNDAILYDRLQQWQAEHEAVLLLYDEALGNPEWSSALFAQIILFLAQDGYTLIQYSGYNGALEAIHAVISRAKTIELLVGLYEAQGHFKEDQRQLAQRLLPAAPAQQSNDETLSCLICNITAPVMRQEKLEPRRLFCSDLCHRKYTHFDAAQ